MANVGEVAATGVEAISMGWLTHSVQALDLGLDIKAPGQGTAVSSACGG